MSAAPPLVQLENVTRSYPAGVQGLQGVSLNIDRAELVAVVGPSGSGKSTMLNLIGTLDRPSSGTVRLDGHDIGALNDREVSALRARTVGFVFQAFHLAPSVPALDNVALGLLYAGTRQSERRSRAEQALTEVGLSHRLDHRPHELSGGERQRVAIARALVGQPRLILADEPTGNLDTETGRDIIDLLKELHAGGTTIVVVTHDREVAEGLRRQVELRDGLVVTDSGSR